MYRTKEENLIKVLETCLTDVNKTTIVSKNHFNFKTATFYLDSLVKNEFIIVLEGPPNKYRITNKGIKLLKTLEEIHESL